MRYFYPLTLGQRVAHERLTRICFTDYDREIALVAEKRDPTRGSHTILGVGRLIKLHGSDAAEFALLIADQVQHTGLGSELLRQLLEVARQEQIGRVVADILPDNRGMQQICEQLGFRLQHALAGPLKAEIEL